MQQHVGQFSHLLYMEPGQQAMIIDLTDTSLHLLQRKQASKRQNLESLLKDGSLKAICRPRQGFPGPEKTLLDVGTIAHRLVD